MRVRPKRSNRSCMMGARSRGRSHALVSRQGGVTLMMQLAPPLALSAMRSWERCGNGFHSTQMLLCLQQKCLKQLKWYSLLLDFSCHTDVFVTWVVILHFLFVGFSAAGEWYSWHDLTTRSFFGPAVDCRLYEDLRLPAHKQ